MIYLKNKHTKKVACVIDEKRFFETRKKIDWIEATYEEHENYEYKKSPYYEIKQLKGKLLKNKLEIKELKEKKQNMYNALKVIELDSKISEWLKINDPKALEQVKNATNH